MRPHHSITVEWQRLSRDRLIGFPNTLRGFLPALNEIAYSRFVAMGSVALIRKLL